MSSICPGGGNGKLCETRNTPRAKMAEYMSSLRKCDRYIPLKTIHEEKMAKNFPPLNSATPAIGTSGEQAEQSHNSGENDVFTLASNTFPMSPIELSEEQVKHLQAQVEALNGQLREEQARARTAYEQNLRSKKHKMVVDTIKQSSEERVADLLSGESEISWETDEEGKGLLHNLTHCLDLSSPMDSEANCASLMENIKKLCRLEDLEKKEERLSKLKTAIVESATKVSKNRTRRLSARSRSNSVKRDREKEEGETSGLSKPRLDSESSVLSALKSEDSSAPTS